MSFPVNPLADIDDIKFANSDVTGPTMGQLNVAEPGAGYKTDGFAEKETPARQHLNFLARWYYRVLSWLTEGLEYVNDEIQHPGAGDSGLGTAAGKDYGTADGQLPPVTVTAGNIILPVDTTLGIITHDADLGDQTTLNRMVTIGSTNGRASGNRSTVAASWNSHASGQDSFAAASVSGAPSGAQSATIGAYASGAAGTRNVIEASNDGQINANATEAVISASDNCDIDPAAGKSNIQINASTGVKCVGDRTQVNASENDGGTFTILGKNSQINASMANTGLTCQINANAAQAQINASVDCAIEPSSAKSGMQINAANGCEVAGSYSQVNASMASSVESVCSQVNATYNGLVTGAESQINASNNTVNGVLSVAGIGNQINASKPDTVSDECKITSAAENSQINASVDCAIEPSTSNGMMQINASEDCSITENNSQINASVDCTVDNYLSQINTSDQCGVTGAMAEVSQSQYSDATGSWTRVQQGIYCEADQVYAAVECSRATKSGIGYSIAGGYGAGTTPITANRQWELDSINGNIYGSGTVAGSHTFADFAEMFENMERGEIPVGTIVALDEGWVRKAGKSDVILGVVSRNPQFLGGDSLFAWAKRYLTDEFGCPVYEEIPAHDYKGEGEAPRIKVRKENPEYKPEMENVRRFDRPEEWTCVGLLGQIHTRVGKGVKSGDFLHGDGSKAKEATNLRCMRVTTPYEAKKGYAVAVCLVK